MYINNKVVLFHKTSDIKMKFKLNYVKKYIIYISRDTMKSK